MIKMGFKLFSTTVLFLSIANPVRSTFYNKEDKVCDPTNTGLVTYTGFRIHREYIVNGLKSPIIHFNSISHCDHGTVDFERVLSVKRDDDIQFNKPFCLLKPNYSGVEQKKDVKMGRNTRLPIRKRSTHFDEELKANIQQLMLNETQDLQMSNGRRGGVQIRQHNSDQEFDVYDYHEIQDIFKIFHDQFDKDTNETNFSNVENIAKEENKISSYGAMTHIMDFAQGLLSKMTTRKKIEEYIGRKKFLTSKDFEVLTPSELSKIDFHEDFQCYNLVRRKKYVHRKMGVYAPFRFVGGIYECEISDEDKKSVMESYKTSLETPFFKCDPAKSIPIAPIVSDDISKQWFQLSTGAHMMQRIPYLYSPTPFDPRFQKIVKNLKLSHWYDELDVNEDYTFNLNEIGYITKVVTDTSNLVCQMLLSMEQKLTTDNESDEIYISKILKNLETRFLTSIGLASEKDLLAKLELMEKTWDEVDI